MLYYVLKHNIHGRLRVSVPHTRDAYAFFVSLEQVLSAFSFVRNIRSNPLCSTIVVQYEKVENCYDLPLDRILESINFYAKKEYDENFSAEKRKLTLIKKAKRQRNQANKIAKSAKREIKLERYVKNKRSADCDCKNAKEQKNLLAPALFRFLSLSSVFGVVFLRSFITKIPMSQTLLSPLGVTSFVFSLPLLKNGYKQLKSKKIALDGFLGAGCMATAASGQSLAAFEILWINAAAELLTAFVTEKSRKSISSILQIASHHTFTLVDGVEVETKVSNLKEGDIVVLHTGEKVCVDGEIIDGHALLDEAPISGRADMVQKSIGDTVLAGTFVSQGLIYVCAKQVGDKTYLSRVLCLVENELANKASIEGIADKLARKLIILGFFATGATLLLTQNISRAFTVLLVMACPCATALSASTAISAAMNVAAKKNILIKGGRYLEAVGKIDCVCFDKTGTLTVSDPQLSDIVLINYNKTSPKAKIAEESELLQLVLSTEMHNHHPLAQAIKQEAEKREILPIEHSCCEYFLGMGMAATINEHEILVGNHKLLELHGISLEPSNDKFHNLNATLKKARDLRLKGKTVLFVVKDRELFALLAFDNPIRKEAKAIIQTLKRTGVKDVYLITGDEENTAKTLAQELGIHSYFPSVMPEEKANIIKELQAKYASVLMVGDGINDAIALTQADIGIAMGAGGSEVAVEAADITLVNDDLCGIVYLRELSKYTIDVVHQNFWIATGSNVVGVVLGAFGIINPVLAGTLHIAHTLGVLASSSRLLTYEVDEDLNVGCEDLHYYK